VPIEEGEGEGGGGEGEGGGGEEEEAVRMMAHPAVEQRDSSHILASRCKVR
jgi:hypothetical protein